jgi:hypothetical protein
VSDGFHSLALNCPKTGIYCEQDGLTMLKKESSGKNEKLEGIKDKLADARFLSLPWREIKREVNIYLC